MPAENQFQKWVTVFFIILTLLICHQQYSLSFSRHDLYSSLARDQVFRSLSIDPLRGKIFAGDGKQVLAWSDAHVSIATDNIVIRRSRRDVVIAKKLSEILNLPAEEILSKIHSRYNATWIKQNISVDELKELFKAQKSGKLTGVHIKREIKRYYPLHPQAANLVGFVQGDRERGYDPLGPYTNLHGVEGLERSYNAELSGKNGHYSFKVNRFGSPEFGSFEQIEQPRDGNNLVTTIDLSLQNVIREELQKGLVKNKAESAMAIALDPMDGSILASVSVDNLPEDFDAFYRSYTSINCWPPELRRNLPTTAVFEPGSVWKPIIMSIAMDHGFVDPNDVIQWHEPIVCGSKAFLDWKKFPPQIMLPEVLVYSSNVGIIQVSKRMFGVLDPDEIGDEIRRVGFARRLPIDFPTRPRGLLTPESWCAISVGAVAEGYELGVTAVQLGSFYCAIANGGYRVDPHFGKMLCDPQTGAMIKDLKPKNIEQIISKTTCDFIRKAMTDCVDHGTGKNGSLKEFGCIAAGKTATAKMTVAGGYNTSKYRASFAGFFPAHDPKIVMIVSVEDPKAGSYYGGAVAAPIFKQIGQRILELYPELCVSPEPDPEETTVVESTI